MTDRRHEARETERVLAWQDRLRRRDLLRRLGVSAAALPFLHNLPSLADAPAEPRRRLIFIFSPNGTVRRRFWPEPGRLVDPLPPILEPLAEFKDRMLTLHGVCDKVRGDGDGHMRGIGCLLTGTELFPGNIQGGSDTPAGWSSGISIDQELRNHLQAHPGSRTRFGSLEFGVLVPDRADTWTRWIYAGPNQPVAPIADPYRMFHKLYGRARANRQLAGVLDAVRDDLSRLRGELPAEDRRLLDEHAALVSDLEKQLAVELAADSHAVPRIEPGVVLENDRMPAISRMQTELLVAALAADFTRIASIQFTNSVGGARFRWLGVEEGQHDLSHEPNSNTAAQEKLTRINAWYAEEVAHLARRLAETPEPGGDGTLLDHTTIIWTNELGEGNSHTLDNIPWVFLGGGLGFKTGQAIDFPKVPHNRLHLAVAHAMGHTELRTFGNPDFCGDGPLTGLS